MSFYCTSYNKNMDTSSVNNTEGNKEEIVVSVCCLAYNHEKYIKKTLEGFIKQKTNFKFEVIINDDASTDNTKMIIQKYVEKYPDIFVPVYQKENQYKKLRFGIVGSVLLPKAQGKYIAFCEGDDYWCDSNKLQTQYDIMENNEECSICIHKVQCINEDGTINPNTLPPVGNSLKTGMMSQEEVARLLFRRYIWQTSGYFLRKKNLDDWLQGKLPFLEKMNGDMRMLLISLSHGKFYYIDEPMSCYRVNSIGSWTSSWQNKNRIEYFVNEELEKKRKYDEYTHFQYHEYILQSMVRNLFQVGVLDGKLSRELFGKYQIKLADIRKMSSIKVMIQYCAIKICPSLYTYICKLVKKEV